jgi:hypothetical protein
MLPACALTQSSETRIPLTESGALNAFKPITNYASAPCSIQRQITAHNSVYDTLKFKREVVYKAPCDFQSRKTEKPVS